METKLKAKVKKLLQDTKATHWTPDYQLQVTDAQAMGILMAQYFEWDGLQILKATYEGLEDSNFHTENETINNLINKAVQSL